MHILFRALLVRPSTKTTLGPTEALRLKVGEDIVIAQGTAEQTDIKLDRLDDIYVKGKEKPIQIYTKPHKASPKHVQRNLS